MDLPGFDRWLNAPYEERDSQETECPECGGILIEDKADRSVVCEDCDYSDGYDWDAEAERKLDREEEFDL